MLRNQLDGKVAIVFDRSSKLGEEIIGKLSSFGGKVWSFQFWTCGKGDEVLLQCYEADKKIGKEINLNDSGGISEIVDLVLKTEGKIDILINNLEKKSTKPLEDLSLEEWEQGLAFNLHAPFQLFKETLPRMKKEKGGVVVNISSVSAINGGDGDVGYASCKSALDSMTKALSREYGPYNIRVNGLAVGEVEGDDSKEILKTIPLQRLAKQEDICNMILLLSSSYADYINGQTILVDGGKTFS